MGKLSVEKDKKCDEIGADDINLSIIFIKNISWYLKS